MHQGYSPHQAAPARRRRFGVLPRIARSRGKSVNPLAFCAPPAAMVPGSAMGARGLGRLRRGVERLVELALRLFRPFSFWVCWPGLFADFWILFFLFVDLKALRVISAGGNLWAAWGYGNGSGHADPALSRLCCPWWDRSTNPGVTRHRRGHVWVMF